VRTHKRLTCAQRTPCALSGVAAIFEEYATSRRTQLIVRTSGLVTDPAWEVADVGLEEIVLAYLGQSGGTTAADGTDDDTMARMEVSR
ncbi:MAG: ABC transporter ATP-binding protein, partial [Nitrososphaerota archaeon]